MKIKYFIHYLKRSIIEADLSYFVNYLKWSTFGQSSEVSLKSFGKFYKCSNDDTLMTFFVDKGREDYLKCLIQNSQNSKTFLDIGANIGIFSILAAQQGNFQKVIALEPSTINYNLLVKNIELNDAQNAIFPLNSGLGNEGQSMFLKFNGSKSRIMAMKSPDTEEVHFTTYKELMHLLIHPVLCKIDTEGMEVEIVNELLACGIEEFIVEIFGIENQEEIFNLLENYDLIHRDETDNFHFRKKSI
jgi:FkbM family methyltransferase